MPPISIENLALDLRIQPPVYVPKRGRPKTRRHRKGEQQRQARKCGRCGETGHNTHTCLGLGDRARRRERAMQWRQEQNDWELDVTMEWLNDEVEAQVRHEACGGDDNDVIINSDSELSQLHSSDFEGMEF